jgi:antitoxin ChpS
MAEATLRKIGGSTVLGIPAALLEQLGMSATMRGLVRVEHDRLVIEKAKRRHYTLEELLAQCDPAAPLSPQEQEWIDAPSVRREIPA